MESVLAKQQRRSRKKSKLVPVQRNLCLSVARMARAMTMPAWQNVLAQLQNVRANVLALIYFVPVTNCIGQSVARMAEPMTITAMLGVTMWRSNVMESALAKRKRHPIPIVSAP